MQKVGDSMAERDNVMINFRLNLSKKSDREIYDYLKQFDTPEFKAILKSSKSNFIKNVLLDFIHRESKEQEAVKQMKVEQKLHDEIVAGVENALEQRHNNLFLVLPHMIEEAVYAAMVRQEINVVSLDSRSSAERNLDNIKVVDKTKKVLQAKESELPEVTDELPMEAFDFLG